MKSRLLLGLVLMGTMGICQNPLFIPDTIHGGTINLSLNEDTTRFFPGQVTSTYGANGSILGPTLIMDRDSAVDINVTNNLTDTTTIHWHGMHVSPENDGGPHSIILPGTTWNPQFTVLDKAATYWYHPHLHKRTHEHVTKGIAGFIIVRDQEEAALNLPRTYGVDDFPMVLQSKAFDSLNQIDIMSHEDSIFMINATIDPYLDAPAQVNRFRLLNGSSNRAYEIGFTGNMAFDLIGTDGGLLAAPVNLTRIRLAPGERIEILIDLTGMQSQSIQMINHPTELPNGQYGGPFPSANQVSTLPGYANNPLNTASYVMLDINITSPTANPVTAIPAVLATVNPLLEINADAFREINFGVANIGPQFLLGPFLFNGDTFDMNRIDVDILLNNTEVWTLQNNTQTAHPFHIHDIQFFILDINGNPPPAYLSGRKDVILVPPFANVRFITQFTDFASDTVPYMYHCHMLPHEDGGMMGQFVVRIPNGIEEVNDENLSVYPNPSTGVISVNLSGTNKLSHYYVFDLQGRLIKSDQMRNSRQIDLSDIDKGVYMLKIDNGQGVFTRKLVIH